MLGHYDPSHNAIVISRILDAAAVPRLVVEYVMFHEMLHLRIPDRAPRRAPEACTRGNFARPNGSFRIWKRRSGLSELR